MFWYFTKGNDEKLFSNLVISSFSPTLNNTIGKENKPFLSELQGRGQHWQNTLLQRSEI